MTCRLGDAITHPKTPSWITQTPEQVADAELEAAGTHYTWMVGIEEGWITPAQQAIGGNYQHHEYWWNKHIEAAWYTAPSYTEKRLGK